MRRMLRGLYQVELNYLTDLCFEREDSGYLSHRGYSAPVRLWHILIAEEYERRAGYGFQEVNMYKLNTQILLSMLLILMGIISVPIMDMDATFCIFAVIFGACGIIGNLYHFGQGKEKTNGQNK